MIVNNNATYDVVVIGGGHSGYEACTASARMGAQTLLITTLENNLGEMSCNPAIGGVGKGHLVREIDALDGIMAIAADKSAIHYHCLNQKKGQAVWGPRVQVDRAIYKLNIQHILNNYPNLDIMFDMVDELLIKDDQIIGIKTHKDYHVNCKKVIITTGTFLHGTVHMGETNYPAGRIREKPSQKLAESIASIGFKLGRMQTCTPARIAKDSINFSGLQIHPSDQDVVFMSFMTKQVSLPQIDCYITNTTKEIHDLIEKNIHRSATYNGNIQSSGPRYCPSIEDKITRFPQKHEHQIFLEPEGLNSNLVYPNGIFTGLACDIQDQFIHMIPGLENCKIVQYGYAIEYDHIHTSELQYTLETKKINGLYFAGQVNGSTGYEEAATQGIVAGINAAASLQGLPAFIPQRSEGYIGVLIDDLITKGITEPYRMFTARSEYRLQLRPDNADQRLTDKGNNWNCITFIRKAQFKNKINQINNLIKILKSIKLSPQKAIEYNIKISQNGQSKSLYELIAYPDCSISKITQIYPQIKEYETEVINTVFAEALYHTYIDKQKEMIETIKKEEQMTIPNNLDYDKVIGLSYEARFKLNQVKPLNIAQASRIPGVTAAAMLSLVLFLKVNNLSK